MSHSPPLRLPTAWKALVKAGSVHTVALARILLLWVRAFAELRGHAELRHQLDLAQAHARLAVHREHIRILQARLASIDARERPRYRPAERLAILQLRATAGWTLQQTARNFLVAESTVVRWMRALADGGHDALLEMRRPVNEFPDFVADTVRRLKATVPAAGRKRIAQLLSVAGLRIAASTVKRMLDEPHGKRPPPTDPKAANDSESQEQPPIDQDARRVTADRPHHVWHVDMTTIPTGDGRWLPWPPFSLPGSWPDSFRLIVVVDHFSRAVLGFSLCPTEPTTASVNALIERCAARFQAPKYVVSDRGVQFRSCYKRLCDKLGIAPRFGAVGEHGSIAIIERFFHSLKEEMLRKLLVVPLDPKAMTEEIAAYVDWYNHHRPHQAIGGLVPSRLLRGELLPSNDNHSMILEPRARYPIPRDSANVARVRRLDLVVEPFRGRGFLPLVELRAA